MSLEPESDLTEERITWDLADVEREPEPPEMPGAKAKHGNVMLHKSFDLLETNADSPSGEFTAIVSTFGNVDRVGDRIMPGAWTKTLAQWEKSGDPIPIVLAHQWDDPFAHIGVAHASDVKQVAKGLQVKGKLDIEDNPVAKQVHRLMQRRSLKEFSIGYDVPTGGEQRTKDGVNEISEINLAECGPCLKGIDPRTELQAVKSALAVADLPDATKQQAAAGRTAREVEAAHVPDLPEQPESEPVEEPKSAEPVVVVPPPDAKKQREEAKRVQRDLERERNDERVADLPEPSKSEPAEEPEPVVESPPDAKKQRENAQRVQLALERERNDERVADLPVKAAPEPVEPDFAALIAEVKAELAETKRLLEEATKPPPVDAKKQDEQAARAVRELEERKLPNVPVSEPAPQVDVGKELQEIKSQLAETRETLEALKKKADETDKEPRRARSVDPLRKQAEAEALEVASGGQSLRKPPQTVAPKRREPKFSLIELKQRTRDEMLGVLSGGTIE